MQKNLDSLIWHAKNDRGQFALTEKQKADILERVGKGCRQETKDKLARRLELPLSLWKRHGIYSRMTLNEDGADYIVGQDWITERKVLRKCILD